MRSWEVDWRGRERWGVAPKKATRVTEMAVIILGLYIATWGRRVARGVQERVR